jgi:uncharacterized protein (TIGR03083 family)
MSHTAEVTAKKDLRRPVLSHKVAMKLAATEYSRWADAAGSVAPGQWRNATDCPKWDVQALTGHVLGMVEMASSVREEARQRKATIKLGGEYIDALTDLQVREHARLTPAELTARLRRIGPKAARGRRLAPGFIRRRAMPVPGMYIDGQPEWWSLGYLLDIILTRDPWMHRVDLSRATSQTMTLTPDHDGVLVDDVVAEWAQRHGQPYQLRLTGPIGGSWSRGSGGEEIEMDAVEFCRALSGRARRDGLLAVDVPF